MVEIIRSSPTGITRTEIRTAPVPTTVGILSDEFSTKQPPPPVTSHDPDEPKPPFIASRSSFILFCISALLTAHGLFGSISPFFIAYVPFLMAILASSRLIKFWTVAGYFMWPAIISGWGLIQLGYNPFAIIPVGCLLIVIASLGTAYLGVGIMALVLSLIPFFPGSPLLVTGTVFPSFGFFGIVCLVVIVIFAERQKRLIIRAALIAILFMSPKGIEFTGAFLDSTDLRMAIEPTPNLYSEFRSPTLALTETGRWSQIVDQIDVGSTVVLGENIFDYDNSAAVSYWCRTVIAKNLTAYIGVLGQDGSGEVWRFDAETCPAPERIYKAQVGIPSVTGSWIPNITSWNAWRGQNDDVQWIACFEGFSMIRWIGIGLSGASQVIVISNDTSVKPFPVGRLRRKVGHEFERLFDVKLYYAETYRNGLVLL